jgi:hypothetical protein
MKNQDFHIFRISFLMLIFAAGCGTDSVEFPIKDHEYIAYARKLMGKDGTREIEDGPHFEYYPNGRKRFEYVAHNGKLNGIATAWDEDGIMTSRLLYRDDIVVKDLLEEAKQNGTGIYKVKVAKNRRGVTQVKTKTDKGRASKAVQNVTNDVTTNAVESVDGRTDAIQPIKKTSGSAVKKISDDTVVF